ncbi:MAG: xanthine dehydrogenase accessory factor [Blastocatellia bacterium]|jgi:xanthine dehydrogenase accessory factor|nr:xanthine dehydrogenase accessory factor [Blastocatellia bacterium]
MPSASYSPQARLITEAIGRILDAGSAGVLATIVAAPENVGAKLLLTSDGSLVGKLEPDELRDAIQRQAAVFLDSGKDASTLSLAEFAPEVGSREARVLFERIELEPRLVICGAGHVGASLARLAALLHYRVTLIDDRAEFITREAFPDERIELVPAGGWKESLSAAVGTGRSISIAIVTRGHKEDEECLRAVMSSAPDYVGLIGSKRRTRFVLEKLRAEGFSAEALDKVRAPIGLDIGAVSPEEVALAILAEIVANRHGGTGSPLCQHRLR